MTVNCPHCDNALQHEPLRAGKTVACPFCAEDLVMPGGELLSAEWLKRIAENLAQSNRTRQRGLRLIQSIAASLRIMAVLFLISFVLGLIGWLIMMASFAAMWPA